MKNIFIYIAVLTLGLASCNSTKWASADAYPDDLYYNPNDKPLTVSDEFIPVFSDKELKKENNKDARSKQSEYISNNPNYALEQVTADLKGTQKSYADLLTDDSVSDIDTVLYYNDETGYWVDGFKGSQMDLDYATRLIKFHGPFVGVPYWSPLYTDVLFANSWDWNVYVDNNYVYAFPSYTSPAYWNSGFYMGFGYGWGGRWGNPWYTPWYDPWYSPYYPPYYGYYPPYYGGYPPYCRPGYGYPPVHGPGYPSDNYHYGPRQGVASSGRMTANSGSSLTSPRSANNFSTGDMPTTRTTRTINSNNNLQIKNGNTAYTRVARSNQTPQDVVKKSGSTTNPRQGTTSGNVRTTRRSYSSYSTSRSAKRSTFNRSTTYTRPTNVSTQRSSTPSRSASGRVYSAPRRSSYSTFRSSRSSSSSKVKSTSRPTYRTGSSRSYKSSAPSSSYSTGSSRSRSSISSSPSRSSRSSGSYTTPSTSGFSRSSGSSGRSSGGGTTRGGRR